MKTKSRKLKLDKSFKPPPADEGDEFFPNGIFVFNITKLLAFISANPEKFPIEKLDVKTLANRSSDHLNEETIYTANVSIPIILAEISPGRFTVIDGNHRLEKARREGLDKIPAYRVIAEQHLAFLNSTNGYEKYIQYWNLKVDDEE